MLSFIKNNHDHKKSLEEKLKKLNAKLQIFIEAQRLTSSVSSNAVYDSRSESALHDLWINLDRSYELFDRNPNLPCENLICRNNFLIGIHADFKKLDMDDIANLKELFKLLKHDNCGAKFSLSIDDFATMSFEQFEALTVALNTINLNELFFCRLMSFKNKVFHSLDEQAQKVLKTNLPDVKISYGEFHCDGEVTANIITFPYTLSEEVLAKERDAILKSNNINDEKQIANEEQLGIDALIVHTNRQLNT